MENTREPGSERLYPSVFSPRKYYLTQLRKEIELVVKDYVQNNNYDCLIDYGCGNEPYKPLFLRYVNKYLGADIPLNKTSELKIDEQGTISVSDKIADIVLSTQVLEHVPDPNKYIQEVKRVLKKDGLFILTTHGYWMYHPDPTDYWRWTSSGLQKIVQDAGFEILSFRGILSRSATGIQLFHDGVYFKLPKILKSIFTFFMQFPIALFDKIERRANKERDASTYIVIAKLR